MPLDFWVVGTGDRRGWITRSSGHDEATARRMFADLVASNRRRTSLYFRLYRNGALVEEKPARGRTPKTREATHA
jgi:hypothetical protein